MGDFELQLQRLLDTELDDLFNKVYCLQEKHELSDYLAVKAVQDAAGSDLADQYEVWLGDGD